MAINENSPETAPIGHFDALAEENKKGQMLVIYLPEGSVIIDRTDIDLSKVPQPVTERTVTAPVVEQKAEEKPAAQPSHATLQEVVQMAVQEVMQNAAKTSPKSEIPTQPLIRPHLPRVTHGIHFPRRRFNWVHGVNIMLGMYIILVTVLPAVLSSGFGISIHSAKLAQPAASISRGDLMICKEVPAALLKTNDVVLVRDANTWRLDVRQVVSRTSDASISTVTTASARGPVTNSTMAVSNASQFYNIESIVPKLGYVPMILTDTITKVIGGILILFLNLRAHYLRSRRRRLGIPVLPL